MLNITARKINPISMLNLDLNLKELSYNLYKITRNKMMTGKMNSSILYIEEGINTNLNKDNEANITNVMMNFLYIAIIC